MNKLVKRLNEALDDKGITKSELARRAGISKQSLNSYFVERTRPNKQVVRSLAIALNVEPAWLVPKHKTQTQVDLADDEAIFTYEGRRIPPEDLEIIRRLMRGGKE